MLDACAATGAVLVGTATQRSSPRKRGLQAEHGREPSLVIVLDKMVSIDRAARD